jgi:8-oxo-dGTP diphosphatase
MASDKSIKLAPIMIPVKVTCAVIIRNNKVLVTQRGPGMKMPGRWEFPGGKVEQGEQETECLLREINEELNIIIRLTKKLMPYVHNYGDIQIELIPFIAEYVSGELTLREHAEYKWLSPDELQNPDWLEADVRLAEEVRRMMEVN